MVKGFADAIAVLRSDAKAAEMQKPIAMLLFGMLNWMFTWFRPDGNHTHATIAPIVCELFFHGLDGMRKMSKRPKPLAKSTAKS